MCTVSVVPGAPRQRVHDIERLLKKEIPRIALAGYEPDPSIKAEPIQNGRQQQRGGGRGGQSQGRGGQGQGRGQQSAPRRTDGEASKARTQDGKPPRRRRPRKPAAAE